MLLHDTKSVVNKVPEVEGDILGLKIEKGVMGELSLLEGVQERMKRTIEEFRKAEEWKEKNDEEILFLIESKNFDAAQQRISELRELLVIWEGTVEYKERIGRVQNLEKALTVAQTPVTATPVTAPTTSRAPIRPQSRLRIDSSDGILRESGGLFGQLRQNLGR